MSEAKFTKGEWGVDYDNCDHGGGEWYVIGNAKVEFSYRATTEEREEAEANAHLIAAAPEMYDMITVMLEQFGNEEDCINEYDYVVIREAKKLLAKARGEK